MRPPQPSALVCSIFTSSWWTRSDDLSQLVPESGVRRRVAVQDPCHLRHVQQKPPVRPTDVLELFVETVELDDEGMCCGAGGAYSVTHAVDGSNGARTQGRINQTHRLRRRGIGQPRLSDAPSGRRPPGCSPGRAHSRGNPYHPPSYARLVQDELDQVADRLDEIVETTRRSGYERASDGAGGQRQ